MSLPISENLILVGEYLIQGVEITHLISAEKLSENDWIITVDVDRYNKKTKKVSETTSTVTLTQEQLSEYLGSLNMNRYIRLV